jgi:hypothetical protein
MRIMIAGDIRDEEVIAEPFEIEGSSDQFAVHRAIQADVEAGKGPWTATHVGTGFAIARGYSVDEAIEKARAAWKSKTPEQIEQAKASARQRRAMRDAAEASA